MISSRQCVKPLLMLNSTSSNSFGNNQLSRYSAQGMRSMTDETRYFLPLNPHCRSNVNLVLNLLWETRPDRRNVPPPLLNPTTASWSGELDRVQMIRLDWELAAIVVFL